ncbi:MAG TPA: di-heme oxidoredictase family protein [Verrucomicrobiales bacterium]|nr:di-heme oxidoredictase family protein [Verrucomicrobiales bacterium]
MPVNPAAFSGGAGTTFNAGKEAYSTPLTNLTRTHRREFVVGNSFFKDNWVSAPATAGNRDGLGPLFHARSCSSCHVQDGRGAPPVADEVMTGLLLRLSVPGSSGPVPDSVYGNQIAVRALPGTDPEADVRVRWGESEIALAGGETFKLRRPDIEIVRWYYGEPAAGIMISPRLAPPVFGGGLLEAVPESAIEALADPDDKDHDGISGRVNHIVDAKSGRKRAGRFGWKASVPSLRVQAAEAFAGDIGITTNEHPQENYTAAQAPKLGSQPDGGKPEADALIMDRMESYLRGLGVPARRNPSDAAVQQGESVFRSLNCTACHVPELRTGGDYPMTELRDQTIRPYTDLLIHDMGADLADHRPDGEAGGTEWRTPPLWGLGLNATVNGNTFYLHDGRARTITEAILWHGGEASKSRDAFKRTAKESRAAVITFLESL